MNELELNAFRAKTFDRLMKTLGMTHSQADFVISLVKHTHSTMGAALYEINDYLDSRGL